MKLRGRKRQRVYDVFAHTYHDVTGTSFSWQKGEKGDVLDVFQCVAEEMSCHDEDEHDEVLEMYELYLQNVIGDWFDWSQSARYNLIGFVYKKENIQLFVAKERRSDDLEEDESEIAGEGSPDSWEF